MPSCSRRELVDVRRTPYYHCISRCVRQAYLCGEDRASGRNFEHRRAWVAARLKFLAQVFAIDVCAYAVMSNHLHVVLHVDAARARGWSEEEVVRRYGKLYRLATKSLPEDEEARAGVVAIWRARLRDLSWMMRALNEHIARRANREDGAKGRFWEGRFKSQPLLDEQGLLTCMAYVDLNPVRAGMATSLEGSDFTSIQARLREVAKQRAQKHRQAAPRGLSPFSGQAEQEDATAVPMSLAAYVELLEWTGRALAPGKRGRITGETPAWLAAQGLSPERWVAALREQQLASATALGSLDAMERAAAQRSRRWLRGVGLARQLVSPARAA